MVTISTGPYSQAQGRLVEVNGSVATIKVGDRTMSGTLITHPSRMPGVPA